MPRRLLLCLLAVTAALYAGCWLAAKAEYR